MSATCKEQRTILLAFVLAGCSGSMGGDPAASTAPEQPDPFAPCVDKSRCCTRLRCEGDPDNGGSCTCTDLWDCSKNPNKCEQDMPVPGAGDWNCVWTRTSYVCTGTPQSSPPGGAGWSCRELAGTQWQCTAESPNPSNKPQGSGVWGCAVDNERDILECERGGGSTSPPAAADSGVPKSPAPDLKAAAPAADSAPTKLPPPKGETNCTDGQDNDSDGKIDCADTDCTCTTPPKTETNCADGIDNDGDGKVDCADTDCKCPPTCPAGQECCDGKDNNGDGRIDEGNVCGNLGQNEPCPPGAYQSCDCYCGVHRRCRSDGTWGPCIVDGNHTCQVAQVTSHSQCGFGQFCDYGKCTSGPVDHECKSHNDCPVGKICDLGECFWDDYHPCP